MPTETCACAADGVAAISSARVAIIIIIRTTSLLIVVVLHFWVLILFPNQPGRHVQTVPSIF